MQDITTHQEETGADGVASKQVSTMHASTGLVQLSRKRQSNTSQKAMHMVLFASKQ